MSREERIAAYVDGELGVAERTAFEAEMQADMSLAREVEGQRRLRERIAGAFAPVLDEPVPDRLAMAASVANDRGRGFGWPQWGAIAASLAVGVLVGRLALPERGPLAPDGSIIVARGDLARALDERLAAEGGPIRVGLTFRSVDGGYCRTFQSAGDRLAGLACRQEGRWVARTTTAWSPAAEPTYRTAGSETPAAVLAAVDELISGEALDAAAERAARDRGWKP